MCPLSAPAVELTPAQLSLIELARSYSLESIERAVAAGASAIWGGGSWESPLVLACGVIPVMFNELWRGEGSKQAEAVGEEHFQIPGEYCSMIKTVLGRLHLRRNDPIRKILYFGASCEPISVAFELARGLGYDVRCLESVVAHRLDASQYEDMVGVVVDELRDLALWLTGAPVDEARVASEIRRKNHTLARVGRLLQLRQRAPHLLPSTATLPIINGANHGFGDPDAFLRVVESLITELGATEPAQDQRAVPLVFAGGGAGGLDIFRCIEESQGSILGWVTFTSFESAYREDVPPLESIARYLLDAQLAGDLGELGGGPAAFRRKRLEEQVARTGARGIVSIGITGCPFGSIVQHMEREYFKARGVPVIALETSVHSEPATEEQKMKLKAFVEMLS